MHAHSAGGGRLPAGLLLTLPAVLFLLVFFVGPLLLNTARSVETPGGIGAGQYLRALTDSYYLGVLGATILLSLAVTLAALLLGYPLAIAIARSSGATKSLLIFLIVTPLLINVVVRTFGWMIILGRSGLINAVVKAFGFEPLDIGSGWFAIWLALVHVLLPFMVLSIASTLEGIDGALEEAAVTLGASPLQTLRHIILPLSLQGVLTGSLLVFALSMGSFVTVMLMGSNATMVLPLLIYQQLNIASDWPFAAALGNILLVVAIVVIALQLRLATQRSAS